MEFVDPSKGIEGVIAADQPISAPIWLVTTIHDYLEGCTYLSYEED
jgi:hypothetical protein